MRTRWENNARRINASAGPAQTINPGPAQTINLQGLEIEFPGFLYKQNTVFEIQGKQFEKGNHGTNEISLVHNIGKFLNF